MAHHGILRCFDIVQRVPTLSCEGFADLVVGSGCTIALTEERAITLQQLEALYSHIEQWCEPGGWISGRDWTLLKPTSVNLYDAVEYVVKPATAARSCSFVELFAVGPQKPTWFVSHWWGEAVLDFILCVRQHATDRCLPSEAAYWVCAYANNQWKVDAEMADNPEDTSFRKAMALSVGTVSVLDTQQKCYTRVWCAYEIFQALDPHSKVHAGRGEDSRYLYDVYTRVDEDVVGLTDGFAEIDCKNAVHPANWIMQKRRREIHFPLDTILKAMDTRVQEAMASVESDRCHILNAIAGSEDLNAEPPEAHGTYEALNNTLAGRFASAGWSIAWSRGESMEQFTHKLKGSSQQRLHLDLSSGSTHTASQRCSTKARLDITMLAENLPTSSLEDLWINFYGSGLCDADVRILGEHLSPKLRRLKLDFGGCKGLAKLDGLGCGLSHLQALSALELYCGDSGLASLEGLARGLEPVPPLKSLVLDVRTCSLVNLAGLQSVLTSFPSLTDFTLDCKVSPQTQQQSIVMSGLDGLQGLAHHPKLETLTMNLTNCKALQSLNTLSSAFVGLSSLRTFELVLDACDQFTNLDDVGSAMSQLHALADFKLSLRELRKPGPSLSSLDGLARGLSGLHALAEIKMNFRGCKSLASLEDVVGMVAGLPALAKCTLNFGGCSALEKVSGLGEALAGRPKLTSCSLEFPGCTALGGVDTLATALAALPESCSCVLDFKGCKQGPNKFARKFSTLAELRAAVVGR
mmetsp:Transcript_136563/g.436896  ORF Transcript_136563/g.436896 Transcript_136563/m.436896 type:complete len:749 (+) Transcript_136563:131-2377(+)